MKTLNFPPVPVFAIEDDLKTQVMKVLEEAAEFVEAFKNLNDKPTKETLARFMEEAADVNQALMNSLYALDIKQETIDDAALYCFGRNFARGRYDE